MAKRGPRASSAAGLRGSAALRDLLREARAFEVRTNRMLGSQNPRTVGVFYRGHQGGTVVPADRRNRDEYRVAERDACGADDGELVKVEQITPGRPGTPRARIVERLGRSSDPGAVSLLAIASHDIPTEFPIAAIAEAEAAPPPNLAGRSDLRDIALVTIDGADACDFDDAVWAEPDPDPENGGGWHIVVAIADVAWYVRPGTVLDREARLRGNSVYFPDRVVPMLPEALSNDLCSLKPGVDRACIAAHLWIDRAGRKRRHRFERGLMCSAARLTYEQAQAAREGPKGNGVPLPQERLAALFGAFAALAEARANRGALELDLDEHRVVFDAEELPVAIARVVRLDSHRLIEEFMVLANVAAAEELEARRQSCMYRIHDSPQPEKLEELRTVLDEIGVPGLSLAKGQAPKPKLFNRILRRATTTPAAALVNELVLRCQAQAAYSVNNIGHFGLALRRYAHFTSPIRRYADLIVHRTLTAGASADAPGSGSGALPSVADGEELAAVAEHISATERRAVAAERTAFERYRAMILARSIGSILTGRISGVAEFGLFVIASENGANGFVPISTLPGDYYEWDKGAHRLIGRRSGRIFRIGDEVSVRLVEVDAIGGRLVFRIEMNGQAGHSPGPTAKRTSMDLRRPARSRSGRRR
jgi:ribonuclease R